MNFNVVGKIIKLWDELLYIKVNNGKDVLVERGSLQVIIKLWNELSYVKVNNGENVLVERENIKSLSLRG